MAATLDSLRARVEALLTSGPTARYTTAVLEESIRLALGEYNLSLDNLEESAVTLAGLDGALETSLPAAHESLLVVGAAGYAASGRQHERIERYDLGERAPADLQEWSRGWLADFRRQLASVRADLRSDQAEARAAGLRQAEVPPWGTAGWTLDAHDGEAL